MNFEMWKERRNITNENILFFRNMKGYKMDLPPSRTVLVYFPEELKTFLEAAHPLINLFDLYYEVEGNRETLTLQFQLDGLDFDCSLYLETLPNEETFDFHPTVQEGPQHLEEHELKRVEPNLLSLYEKMKQFILDYSPNRLRLVTSTYDTILPVWLWDLVYSGESS